MQGDEKICGLVGIITASNNGFHFKEAETLEDMLYMDALRGVDATGIMYGTINGDVQIHKEASPAHEFLATNEWDRSSKELFGRGSWCFGHNRAATRGAKIDKNSHPFNINDKIILMQNGTYLGSHKHHKDTDVDTEACAHVIEESSSVQEALSKINAAYAFIWYNVEEKSINIVRNKERPLWWAKTKAGSFIFSSEAGIMLAATSRRGVELDEGPSMISPGEHWKITKQQGKIDIEIDKVDTTYKGSFRQDDDYGAWWAGKGWKVGEDNLPKQIPNRVASGSPSFRSLSDAALEVDGVYASSMTPQEVDKVVMAHRDRKTPVLIEALDYKKVAPSDANCDQYYIIGEVVAPEDSPLSGLPVGWTVTYPGTDEKNLLEYVTNNFFSGRLSNIIRRAKPTPSGYSAEEIILIGQVTEVEIATVLEPH